MGAGKRAGRKPRPRRPAGRRRQAAVNTLRRAERELVGFAERLRSVRVLDPACGSGNFLYVSLKELLDLEKEVSTFAGELGMTPFFPGVNPEQLHGIETSPYAHELAQVAIWIGYLQWMIDNGFGTPAEPILGPMTNIVEMDAILARDEDGNAPRARLARGGRDRRQPAVPGRQTDPGGARRRVRGDLFALYSGTRPREADLVSYWFEKARDGDRGREGKRAGLLATNSIRGGANRRVLERIKETGDIFFAESDRPWVSNGAAVRVSMVGFDDGTETEKMLDGAPVEQINPDLTGALDLTSARPLHENSASPSWAINEGWPFDIPGDLARTDARRYRRIRTAGRTPMWCGPGPTVWTSRAVRANMWIIDFGTEMPLEDAALYEAAVRVCERTRKPMRETEQRKTTGRVVAT